jgi:small multidrug resistance family-3 protein
MKLLLVSITYLAAGFAEIAGCFAFWAWLKMGRSALWAIPGTSSLLLFAFLLTRIDSSSAGRAYAAYGGVYILASLLWMHVVEGKHADRWDGIGAAICVIGSLIIMFGPRAH